MPDLNLKEKFPKHSVNRQLEIAGKAGIIIFITKIIGYLAGLGIIIGVNIPEGLQDTTNCTYGSSNKECPRFTLDTMVSETGNNLTDMALLGGSMSLLIEWKCDAKTIDSFNKCKPSYSFERIDQRYKSVAPGTFIRFAHYYNNNGVQERRFVRGNGISVKVTAYGSATRPDMAVMSRAVGSYWSYLDNVGNLVLWVALFVLFKWYPGMKQTYEDKLVTQITEKSGKQNEREMNSAEDSV